MLGTRRIFDFIHNNPAFEFHPTQYINDPFVIAQNERMIAINSAIQVDLTGQVCADSMGAKPYSGFGGQLDFIRGAARSKGGKPIIALPSTAKKGAVSRIVPVLDPGAGVVTGRAEVHYVVTEYGVAYLWGKTLRQRAEALIAIADPRFRDEFMITPRAPHYVERARSPGGGMTNTAKPDRGMVELNSEECKGCGLCVEACPPKVLLLADRLNRYGYHPADLRGRGLHRLRHLLLCLSRAGRHYGAAGWPA